MFKNKKVKTINKLFVVEPKVVNPSIHVVDVNMAITRSKVIEEQVFNDRKPIKKSLLLIGIRTKTTKIFVKTIQEMQAKDPLENLNRKEKAQWNTSWVGLVEIRVSIKPIIPTKFVCYS
jgi:hypothetical protein